MVSNCHPPFSYDGLKGRPMQSTPVWTHGYDLAELKEIAAVFVHAHKPHVYGAFGMTKERDIADAKAHKNLTMVAKRGIQGAAIGHMLERGSKHTDFSGREISLPARCYYVKSFAALDTKSAIWLLSALQQQHEILVVEIFEEDLAAKHAVQDFAYIGSKVMAGSEVKGLYIQGDKRAYATPKVQQATLVCLDNNFAQADLGKIRFELETYTNAVKSPFHQHYSSYNKRGSWTAFSLRGFQPDNPGFIIKPAEMAKAWKDANPMSGLWACKHTVAAPHFPETWRLLRSLPCAGFERVRFMRLAKGDGELSRHADITDRAAGPGLGQIARFHIPIHTNQEVTFLAWTERGKRLERHLGVGSLWYLDTRKPHSVLNSGESERVHLVVDVVCNKQTQQLIQDGQ